MILLKPYLEYKDSGTPWLGEIPAHWRCSPNRALFEPINDRDHPADPMLSVTIGRGVIRQAHLLEGSSKKDSSNENKTSYKLVQPQDIAYNKMRAWQGAIGVSEYRGIVSGAYVVMRPRADVNSSYFHHLMRTPAFAKEAERWSYGITSDQWSLRAEDFKQIYSAVPPPAEQSAIVRFLNHADHRIRRYISAKQKLIKLLAEQKQAIIHHAVTRGLDPIVRLKPSGVEWLGDVPEHWEPVRLKEVALVQTGITLGKVYGESMLVERPYLRVANVQTGRLDLLKVTTVRVPMTEANGATLQSGDVLMTEGGDIDKLGRGCVWRGEIPECLHQNHVFAVRPNRTALLPEFLVALMGSPHGRSYFQLTAKQTTNLAATNSTTLGNFPLRLPPAEEQGKIVKSISDSTQKLDIAIDRAHCEISLLREYRTRLIADVVTGKLDVREAAAELPEDAAELQPVDEAEDLTATDDDEPGDPDEGMEGDEV